MVNQRSHKAKKLWEALHLPPNSIRNSSTKHVSQELLCDLYIKRSPQSEISSLLHFLFPAMTILQSSRHQRFPSPFPSHACYLHPPSLHSHGHSYNIGTVVLYCAVSSLINSRLSETKNPEDRKAMAVFVGWSKGCPIILRWWCDALQCKPAFTTHLQVKALKQFS